ncbi:SH3 domain-containing protein [Mesorhizobium sp. M0991]|uniref:SH3 domain-containing protein n=1 Tax=Mesorhizobium sp. M0991 TaxID=2957043 RepID=UPI0033356756
MSNVIGRKTLLHQIPATLFICAVVVPAVLPANGAEAPAIGSTCIVSDPNEPTLNLRAVPRGKKLGVLPNGQSVTISMIQNDDRGLPWARIPGGWVYANFLNCRNVQLNNDHPITSATLDSGVVGLSCSGYESCMRFSNSDNKDVCTGIGYKSTTDKIDQTMQVLINTSSNIAAIDKFGSGGFHWTVRSSTLRYDIGGEGLQYNIDRVSGKMSGFYSIGKLAEDGAELNVWFFGSCERISIDPKF